MLKFNYMITVGDKELENKTISLRTRDNIVHGEMQLDDFVDQLVAEKHEKKLNSPFSSKK